MNDIPVLQASGLTRSFGTGEVKTTALAGVSLELYRGQMALLMGPSGSGKSTLLAILSGLLSPDQGEVIALGQSIWGMNDIQREEFRRLHCGFIFQGYNLFPALTAREQLEIVLRWGENVPAGEARARADEVLALLGLGKKGHLRPHQLSGGEKQRVSVGRALVKQPAFCFADEPTSALDWRHGEQVVEQLCAASHEQGTSVLVVSHDARLVPYADQVFYLEDGLLARSKSSAPARSATELRSVS